MGYAQSQGRVPAACHPEAQSWDQARGPPDSQAGARLAPTGRTHRTLQAVPPPPGTSQRDVGVVQLPHFAAKKTDIQSGPSPNRQWSKAEPQTGVAPSIQKDVTSLTGTCGHQSKPAVMWSQPVGDRSEICTRLQPPAVDEGQTGRQPLWRPRQTRRVFVQPPRPLWRAVFAPQLCVLFQACTHDGPSRTPQALAAQGKPSPARLAQAVSKGVF